MQCQRQDNHLTFGVSEQNAVCLINAGRGQIHHRYVERNLAVRRAIHHLIEVAHKDGKTVSICGQAPSVYPELCEKTALSLAYFCQPTMVAGTLWKSDGPKLARPFLTT